MLSRFLQQGVLVIALYIEDDIVSSMIADVSGRYSKHRQFAFSYLTKDAPADSK
jgi:hypothetical protein